MNTIYRFRAPQHWKRIQNRVEMTTCFEIISKELRISDYFLKCYVHPKTFQGHKSVVIKWLVDPDLRVKNFRKTNIC
jgi:hypothetical protein